MNSRWRLTTWLPIVFGLFFLRLLFGLSREFFFEDETQIYVLGLRYYATGHWPFFGPDVVWTRSEIPGALQALLVGLPLKIAPIPESPFVLLNLLSFTAIAAFSWYVCQRLPGMPRWLVWGWFVTIPWTLQFSTHVINPSYVLPAALVFFLGFFEALPAFSLGHLSPLTAHFLMGAAVTWVMQIHMSWPLLLPYVVIAWISRRHDGIRALARYGAAFGVGAVIPGLLLIPTFLRYGIDAGSGGTLRNIRPHPVNPWVLVTTLARFLSFASLEINRFISTDGAKRIEFFERHAWLVPAAAVVWAAGVLQPIWMFREWWRRSTEWPEPQSAMEWRALRLLVAGTVLVVYASYWFVFEPAQAHAFYVLAPIAFMFAAYCWRFVDSARWRAFAAGILTVNVMFHAGLAVAEMSSQSLYKNRGIVATAIRLREPEMFAHRRAFAIDGAPYALQDPARPYDVRRDVEILTSTWRIGMGRSLRWRITLRNKSDVVAFRDLLYITTYRDRDARVVDQRHEFIKDFFEPGVVRTIDVNDGYVRSPFASATIEIAAAEALLPVPERGASNDIAPHSFHTRSTILSHGARQTRQMLALLPHVVAFVRMVGPYLSWAMAVVKGHPGLRDR